MEKHLAQIKLDEYKPLRDLVTENLRQAIVKGVFPPGSRLMEIQLATEMGVSRTPVREAIRKLELEGLVVMIPRRGAYVANLSIKDISDVYEIRTALDELAARLAAERINDEELEELQRDLVLFERYAEERDVNKIVELDGAFHDVLYRASRNDRLVGIISNLREQITSIRGRSMLYPGRLKKTIDEHREIVDCIAQRDPDKSERAVRRHMEQAERTLLKLIEEQSEEAQGEKDGKD